MSRHPSVIRRAVAGDEEAIEQICHDYRSMIFRFARHLDRRSDEEQVNIILLKVLEALKNPSSRFDENFAEKFTAWIFGVSRNVIRHDRRNRARRAAQRSIDSQPSEDRNPFEPRARLTSPSGVALRKEVRAWVRRRVKALPPIYRDTLTLHWIDGLTCAQIARKQGVPEVTVRQRLKRGQDRLRTSMKQTRSTLEQIARASKK